MYTAYIALVVCFVLVIILHAWFVRRLSTLRDRARAGESECRRLRMEAEEVAETVAELNRGRNSNQVSIVALEREIEGTQALIREFLEAHEDLREEFGSLMSRDSASSAGHGAGEREEDPERSSAGVETH